MTNAIFAILRRIMHKTAELEHLTLDLHSNLMM